MPSTRRPLLDRTKSETLCAPLPTPRSVTFWASSRRSSPPGCVEGWTFVKFTKSLPRIEPPAMNAPPLKVTLRRPRAWRDPTSPVSVLSVVRNR
jgi:hypothetical protein